MSHPKRSHASTSSEQSAASANMNFTDELPDVVLESNSEFKRIDRRRFSFALAEAKQTELRITVDLTELCDPAPLKAKFEDKEIDLTQEDKALLNTQELAPPFKNAKKKASKQTGSKKQQDKVSKKNDLAAEKELKKQQKEEEKRAKAEFDEINKMYKPGECLKHVQLEMHPQLSQQWFMEDVKREVAMLGVKVVETPTMDVNTLAWTREEPRALVNDGGQLKLSTQRRECSHKIYIIPAREILSGALHWDRRIEGGTFIVFGSQELMRSGSSESISKAEYAKLVNELQIDVMVQCKVELVLIESSMELGLLVLRYTRAVADAPYKKARRDIDEQAEFYMRGDNKNCVTVDKDGNGLSRLWEQMIATLPMSSLEVARSLGAEYKSPRGLVQELELPGGITRVSQLGVARTNVPGSKARKLGPEFTRKLHTLFTSENGNQIIE